jgi:hypothetical protein
VRSHQTRADAALSNAAAVGSDRLAADEDGRSVRPSTAREIVKVADEFRWAAA